SKIETAADVVGVIEFVIAYPDLDIGQTVAVAASREQSAETRGNREVLLLVDHVLDEIGRFQTGQAELGGAIHFVVHGLEEGIRSGSLRAEHRERSQSE